MKHASRDSRKAANPLLRLGDALADTRRARAQTLDAVALELGVSAHAVSTWEASYRAPHRRVMPRIAEYLGVPLKQALDMRLLNIEHREHCLAEGLL